MAERPGTGFDPLRYDGEGLKGDINAAFNHLCVIGVQRSTLRLKARGLHKFALRNCCVKCLACL